jgi:IcmF-related N-terminal domain
MGSIFAAIWGAITRIFSALGSKVVGESSGKAISFLGTCVRWLILLCLFVGFEYALYYFNDAINLGRWLPDFSPRLKPYYAPLVGLIIILVGVVLYFFFATWDTEAEESPFPDLDAAWQAALEAVNQAGILPHQVSLFLVLGRPESAEVNMFDGAGVKWVVKHAPPDPNAPLHVYAEKESSPKSTYPGAIYVTCRGASVLGKLAGILARDETVMPAAAAFNPESSQNALDTVGAVDRDAAKAKEIVAATQGREATVLEKRKAYRADRGKPLASDLLADTAEVTRLKARLAYLCRLIARARGSECAANGILLLIPLAGTDTIGEAQLTAQACLEDLTTVRSEIKIDCPVITMLVDLEDLPGFTDFLSLQRPKELAARRGGSFPMATRLTRDELRTQIRTSLAWVCTTYLQDSVYAVFQSETDANKEVSPLFPRNSRLAMLLTEMNDRADAVCDIVLSAMMPENEPMFRYSGFYFGGTGAVGVQGFIAGVFQKLVKEQASVTWTQAALDEDAKYYASANSYATATYALLVLLGVVAAGFGYYVFRG